MTPPRLARETVRPPTSAGTNSAAAAGSGRSATSCTSELSGTAGTSGNSERPAVCPGVGPAVG